MLGRQGNESTARQEYTYAHGFTSALCAMSTAVCIVWNLEAINESFKIYFLSNRNITLLYV